MPFCKEWHFFIQIEAFLLTIFPDDQNFRRSKGRIGYFLPEKNIFHFI